MDSQASNGKFHVWLLIGSGIVAASQIGKAIISLPMIRVDLALGLDVAGLMVAIFATLGASFGIGAGVVVQSLGVRRSLVGGMAIIAIGNLIGAAAPSEPVLLIGRIVEGVGFFGAVLAIPSMLSRIVACNERDFVMGVWSAYMPTGIALMLLLGPLLPMIGWRNLWFASALFAGGCSVLLAIYAPAAPASGEGHSSSFFGEVVKVIRNPRCLALACGFFAYSCQIFSMTFALPQLLTSDHGATLGAAGLLSAAVLAVSTLGHVSSGYMLRIGVPVWANLAAAFGFFAVTSFVVYAHTASPASVAVAAALALGVGGLAPGALYAAAPRVAPGPHAVPSTIGLLQQASNLGQFAGPAVLGFWVQNFGWHAAPAIVVPAALVGLSVAFAVRGAMQPSAMAISGRSAANALPARPE
jgi:DHA1 family inner membrane transport protein